MVAKGESPKSSVLVTGDVVTDHYVYEGQQRRPGSRIVLGTIEQPVAGGAALLYRLLLEISSQRQDLSVSFGWDPAKLGQPGPSSYCVMRPFEKEPKSDREPKSEEKVWRMAEPLGFGEVDTDVDLAAVDEAALAGAHTIVVLDDAGLAFRRWPTRPAWPRFLLESSRPLPAWLVIKMSGPVAAGDLWHTLVSGQTQDGSPREVRTSAEMLSRTVAVMTINDLRVEPIHVSKNLSWERAALDLFHELRKKGCLEGLQKLRFIVVSFGTDGALIAEFPSGEARLVFDPARLEGDFASRFSGALFGYQSCLAAAIVAQLAVTPSSDRNVLEALEKGVRAGLSAQRLLIEEGHGPVGDSPPGFPHSALAKEISSTKRRWPYGGARIPDPDPLRSDSWTIIARGSLAGPVGPLFGLARRVAKRGVQQLRQTPYLQFGKLFSVERTEIESLRTLQRLLRTYQEDRKATKPLSIAAFGPPGSGKSFGVKQLAKAVFDDNEPPLEFNLSQFQDPIELHGLLHQVRDRVLMGKLPVVFWDEFDSQDLRWLQYLLAPMQDGTFQEGPITHPIGKCVFVFAGGTRSRFEDFGLPPPAPPPSEELRPSLDQTEPSPPSDRRKGPGKTELLKEREKWDADFKAKKGPDFKSRLAGYINVLGPDQRDERDVTYPVRRALLLRVHLDVEERPLAIEPGLLEAFLRIDRYRHGARSLEKIAEQVRQNSRTKEFTRSDLPSRSELDLHVNAKLFLELMENQP